METNNLDMKGVSDPAEIKHELKYGVRKEGIEMLNWLIKFGSLSIKEFMVLKNQKREQVKAKLSALERKKLVLSKKHKYTRLKIYKISKKGMKLVDPSYRDYSAPSKCSYFYLQHKLGMCRFISQIGLSHNDLWTDRELTQYKKELRGRIPDLVLLKPTELLIDNYEGTFIATQKTAIEIEETPKTKDKYKKIVEAYEKEPVIYDEVVWVVNPKFKKRVEGFFDELKEEGFFGSQRHYFLYQSNKTLEKYKKEDVDEIEKEEV